MASEFAVTAARTAGILIRSDVFAGSDAIALATDLAAPATCSSGQGTFCAFIPDATSSAPTLAFFQNSLPTSPQFNVWRASDRSLTFTDRVVIDVSPGPVPEPGSRALMLVGFGGLGAALRAVRRGATVTA